MAEVERRTITLVVDGDKLSASVDKARHTLESLNHSIELVKRAFEFAGIGLGIHEFVEFTEKAQDLDNIIRTLDGTTITFARTQAALLEVANHSESALDGVTRTYAALSRALKGTGTDSEEVLKITETLTEAFKVAGTNIDEAQSTVLGLAKSLAIGRLESSSFRASSEAGAAVMNLLADGLHKTREELDAMSRNNLLTRPVILKGLVDGAAAVEVQFQKTGLSIAEAFTMLQNVVLRLFSEINTHLTALNNLAQLFKLLADNIDIVSTALIYIAEVALARYAIVKLLAFTETIVALTTTVLPALTAGILGVEVALGGWIPLLATAAAGFALLYVNQKTAAEGFDSEIKRFAGLPVDELKKQVEELTKTRDELAEQRGKATGAAPSAPLVGFEGAVEGATNAGIAAEQYDEKLRSANSTLEAARTALDQATIASQGLGDGFKAAKESTEEFDKVIADLTRTIGLNRLQLDALHAGNLKQFEDIKAQETAYQRFESTKSSIEAAQKRALNPSELGILYNNLLAVAKGDTAVSEALKAYNKSISDAEAATRKANAEWEAGKKKIEEYDQKVQDLRDNLEIQQQIGGDLGASPENVIMLNAQRDAEKEILRFRLLAVHTYDEQGKLLDGANESLITQLHLQMAINQIESQRLDLARANAYQQRPALGQRKQLQDSLTAANDPKVLDKLSPDEKQALVEFNNDLAESMTGVGEAAAVLQQQGNPYAGLLDGLSKFHEASVATTNSVNKQFQLVGQGIGSTLEFITQQAASLGVENFRFNQALQIAQATINAAMAISQVLASDIPYPANVALAAVVGALATAQVERIAAQQPPQRMSGGAVSAGMPYQVGERGPELYRDTSGRQILIPSQSGNVQSKVPRGDVNIINTGSPLEVTSKTERDDGGMDIVVRAVKASEDRFEHSLRTGQGKYSASMQRHTSARRQL